MCLPRTLVVTTATDAAKGFASFPWSPCKVSFRIWRSHLCTYQLASHAAGYFALSSNVASSEIDDDPAVGCVCLAHWWLLQLPMQLMVLVPSHESLEGIVPIWRSHLCNYQLASHAVSYVSPRCSQ